MLRVHYPFALQVA